MVSCKICNKKFSPRPSHVKKGWGVYCSRKCKNVGSITGQKTHCFICKKEIYKTKTQINRSKSGKYFCNKSCQTKWRNKEYSGVKHLGWKGGLSRYKDILLKNGKDQKCKLCGEKDSRVLAVHHVDENHKNNELLNLAWLCHNCHQLVHYDSLEKQKFLLKHNKRIL